MKKVKRIVLTVLCVLLVGVFCGCGAKFDAKGYVSAMLDACYKGDYTAFVDMKLGTKEEGEALYEQGLDAEMDGLLAGQTGISEELENEFREIFKEMLGKVKYTVGEAEEQSDGSFVVTVTYEQMKIYEPVMEGYLAEIEEMAAEWMTNLDSAPSEDEMTEAVVVALKDHLKSNLASVQYADPVETTIRVEKNDNVYSLNEEDTMNLETILFDLDAVE